MADDNVMYDTPLEFMAEVAQSDRACIAQSVIPLDSGDYICACSCEQWVVTASTQEDGLRLARKHVAETSGSTG